MFTCVNVPVTLELKVTLPQQYGPEQPSAITKDVTCIGVGDEDVEGDEDGVGDEDVEGDEDGVGDEDVEGDEDGVGDEVLKDNFLVMSR